MCCMLLLLPTYSITRIWPIMMICIKDPYNFQAPVMKISVSLFVVPTCKVCHICAWEPEVHQVLLCGGRPL